MKQPTVRLVYDSAKPREFHAPPEMGEPRHDQLIGTPLERLAEVAGRVCYDSMGEAKSRGSAQYHAHIQEVKHLSVYEHCTFVVAIPFSSARAETFLNRPSLWVGIDRKAQEWRVVMNLRHALEWGHERWGLAISSLDAMDIVRSTASMIAPQAYTPRGSGYGNYRLREPRDGDEAERWLSFYIGGVSRGLSHELVRHGDYTAISQRSTRYCDEDGSAYAWHPLITDATERHESFETHERYLLRAAEDASKEAYRAVVAGLLERGHDRKSARGAARGVLGNALETELIFSASLAQWRVICAQRTHPAADGEIRRMAKIILDLLP